MNDREKKYEKSELKEKFLISNEVNLSFMLKPFGKKYYSLPFSERYAFWKGVVIINVVTILVMFLTIMIYGDHLPTKISLGVGILCLFWWYMKWYNYIKQKSDEK